MRRVLRRGANGRLVDLPADTPPTQTARALAIPLRMTMMALIATTVMTACSGSQDSPRRGDPKTKRHQPHDHRHGTHPHHGGGHHHHPHPHPHLPGPGGHHHPY